MKQRLHLVGHEVSPVDEGLCLLAQLGVLVDVLTEEVAGAHVLELKWIHRN